jgi:hypothetical protein
MATFMFGSSVLANVSMATTSLDALWQRIRHDEVLKADVERLRKVRRMDSAAYGRLKTNLPFFCCADFNNGLRHSQHFVSAAGFVVDIDKYSGEQSRLETLRDRICSDDRVAMCFISPSGEGLKVVFHLAEPCTNLKEFSDFYKIFVSQWANDLDIMPFVDLRTADATRACFLSHDAFAYINPMAGNVVMSDFLPMVCDSIFNAQVAGSETFVSKGATTTATKPKTFEPDANCSHHIQPDTYAELMVLLKSKAKPNPLQRRTFVPEPLVHLMAPLAKALATYQINVLTAKDIQYGKQVQVQCAQDFGEMNIYYGKKGFSVVLSMKSETNYSLNELIGHIAEQAIAEVLRC